jgi:hypothetical protein
MTDTVTAPPPQRRRFHFDWVLPTLLRPRWLFAQVREQESDSWLTPLLILTLAEVGRVLTVGWLKQSAAASGQTPLPDGFEFWTPEQQAQFFQAQQATTGPTFVYVFPAIGSMLGLWITWLLIASILHLALTLLGGRSQTRAAINFVAWALLPLALRSLVSLGYMLYSQTLIVGYGLAGFAPGDGEMLSNYLKEFLAFVDVYLLWAAVLMALGAMSVASLPARKAWGGVLITMLIVLALHALPGFIAAQVGGLQFLPIY